MQMYSIFISIQCPVMIAVGGRKICDDNNLPNNSFPYHEFTDLNHSQLEHIPDTAKLVKIIREVQDERDIVRSIELKHLH